MKLRQWYLGIGAAAAALIPLAANADPVPDLTGGYQGQIEIKFSGVTTETPDIGTVCAGGVCPETTWGAGLLTSTNPVGDPGDTLWFSGTNGQRLGFVIYGIADEAITPSGGGVSIDNVGATTSVYGSTNGHINLDIYTFTAPDIFPCFGTGCSGELITPSDRTANSTHDGITNAANVTGITDVGELFMHIELVPGVSTDPDVVLVQNVTAATLPASGNGSFYANCISGPGCAQFDPTVFDSVNAYFHGIFDLELPIGPEATAGWLGEIRDPITAFSVPEPASLALLGTALTMLGLAVHRRRRGTFSA